MSQRRQSLNCELLDAFGCSALTASSSAFIQQREKIRHEALADLFRSFVRATPSDMLYKGYRLLAVDGSDLHVPTNPQDTQSCITKKDNSKPVNLLHLNAVYDLLSHTYTDAVVQKCHTKDEHRAFCDMVDRAEGKPTVFIADRGYESFNYMAHVQEKGWFFLFRFKDNSGDRFRLLHAGYGRIRYVVFYVSHQKTDERNETVTERQERLPLCPLFQYLRLSSCQKQQRDSRSALCSFVPDCPFQNL